MMYTSRPAAQYYLSQDWPVKLHKSLAIKKLHGDGGKTEDNRKNANEIRQE